MHKVSPRMLFAAAAIQRFAGRSAAAPNEDPPIISRQDGGENYIEIPGVGRVPLPPGAKCSNRAAPSGLAATIRGRAGRPESPAPPPAPKSPEQARAAALDDLLARLKTAADEPEALAIGARNRGLFATRLPRPSLC